MGRSRGRVRGFGPFGYRLHPSQREATTTQGPVLPAPRVSATIILLPSGRRLSQFLGDVGAVFLHRLVRNPEETHGREPSILHAVDSQRRLAAREDHTGIFGGRFGRLNMLVCVYAANSIMLLGWIRITTAAGLIAWAAVFGFVSGAIISLYPVSIAQLAPRPQEIGTYMGQASAVVSVAGLTGTPIAGALIRSYGYEAAALFAGLSMVVCTCLAAVSRGFYAGKLLAKV